MGNEINRTEVADGVCETRISPIATDARHVRRPAGYRPHVRQLDMRRELEVENSRT
jgi:hypothetical protein